MSREALAAAVAAYFDALDRLDADAAAARFADDAILVCENEGMELRGRKAIRAFFAEIVGESRGMRHEVTSLVLDEEGRRAAAELVYRDELKDGRRYDMCNCNVFDVDEDGRFSRVRFWLGGTL